MISWIIGIILIIPLLLKITPPWIFLQPKYWVASRKYGGDGCLRPISPFNENKDWEKEGLFIWNKGLFPLVISPQENMKGKEWDSKKLTKWIENNQDWIKKQINEFGAIIFRGFPINETEEFEKLSFALAPNLQEDFLRSTPRSKVDNSNVVFTASDDPPYAVIPAHCERCWIENPPKFILFYAQVPNQSKGGETPLIDFRQVWKEMDQNIRDQFIKKGILYRRQFYDEKKKTIWEYMKRMSWPVPTHWQQMFGTNDVNELENQRKQLGFDVKWLNGKEGDGIIEARSKMAAFRSHPITGEEIWHNHLNILHSSSHSSEYAFSSQHLNTWKHLLLHYYMRFLSFINWILFGDKYIGETALFGDGSNIPDHVIWHIRKLVWKNTLIYRHQKNDVVFVDNYRLAHARQPFSGFRRILTTWA